MPRAPAGTCARWPPAGRSRWPRRRPASAPPTGRRPAGRARPPLVRRPTASAGLTRPPLGGDVGEGHQAHRSPPVVEQPGEGLDRDLAVLVVGHHLECTPSRRSACSRVIHPVAYSAPPVRARSPGRRPAPERLVPGEGGVLDEHLGRRGADQGGDLGVGGVALAGPLLGQLVAAHHGLGPQPLDLSVEHHPGRQAAAGVVEVGDGLAPGCRPAPGRRRSTGSDDPAASAGHGPRT